MLTPQISVKQYVNWTLPVRVGAFTGFPVAVTVAVNVTLVPTGIEEFDVVSATVVGSRVTLTSPTPVEVTKFVSPL